MENAQTSTCKMFGNRKTSNEQDIIPNIFGQWYCRVRFFSEVNDLHGRYVFWKTNPADEFYQFGTLKDDLFLTNRNDECDSYFPDLCILVYHVPAGTHVFKVNKIYGHCDEFVICHDINIKNIPSCEVQLRHVDGYNIAGTHNIGKLLVSDAYMEILLRGGYASFFCTESSKSLMKKRMTIRYNEGTHMLSNLDYLVRPKK